MAGTSITNAGRPGAESLAGWGERNRRASFGYIPISRNFACVRTSSQCLQESAQRSGESTVGPHLVHIPARNVVQERETATSEKLV